MTINHIMTHYNLLSSYRLQVFDSSQCLQVPGEEAGQRGDAPGPGHAHHVPGRVPVLQVQDRQPVSLAREAVTKLS